MMSRSEFISEAKVAANDPLFLQRIFTLLSKSGKKQLNQIKDPIERVIIEEFNDVSRRADRAKIQHSCSIRNVIRSRELAKCLVDQSGEINLERLNHAVTVLKAHLYPLGPNRQFDSERQKLILKCLVSLQQDSSLIKLVQSLQKPHLNHKTDHIIRKTLAIEDSTVITNQLARQAALAAWFCTLRQSVGSCFATAPAIIVHDEQPYQFFRDIKELYNTGLMRRIVNGVAYTAPLSPSWGAGDLKRLVIIQCDPGIRDVELWLSPGLMAAYEVVGLVDARKPLRSRIKELRDHVTNYLDVLCEKNGQILTSAEELIRHALMRSMQLTPQDFSAEKEHSLGQFHGLMRMSAEQGESRKIKLFREKLVMAHEAFKAVSDNALLKSWEFTLASFAETKPAFSRWNMYAGLGLRPDQPGGIGECLYGSIKEKLEDQNRKVRELNEEYESKYPTVRYLETRLRTAATEEERRWLKIDYNAKRHDFEMVAELRDKAQSEAQWLANLYNLLIDQYDESFPRYFQEIYDADMHDVGASAYDDSPAGFRLLYKHGLENPVQWTTITSSDEYVESLVNFFNATEREMIYLPDFQGKEKLLGEIISRVVTHLGTKRFIETAFDRMAIAYHQKRIEDPLNNLDKIDKKPWAYTSGGSLDNLMKAYWKNEEGFDQEGRWVESQTELFVFIVDVMKHRVADNRFENGDQALLAHSPTHAFLINPNNHILKEAVKTKEYTYTWVRDRFILPRDRFIDRIKLTVDEMQTLIEVLSEDVESQYRHFFRRAFGNLFGTMSPSQFRQEIKKGFSREQGLNYQGVPVLSMDSVDRTLYELLPLFTTDKLEDRIKDIIAELPGMEELEDGFIKDVLSRIKKTLIGIRYLGARHLIEISAAVVLLCLGKTSYEYDYHQLIVKAARNHGYAVAEPIIFADTNWVLEKFAFVVNPGTNQLELWRVDPFGARGSPMSVWRQWLDGSRKDREWGVYTKPIQYRSDDAVRKYST